MRRNWIFRERVDRQASTLFQACSEKLAIDGTLFDKSFARIVWMPVAEIFSSYSSSTSLPKPLASTTNRTWDGDSEGPDFFEFLHTMTLTNSVCKTMREIW
jgi:hypothetical protein